MAINYDKLGPLGSMLRKFHEHPPGTVYVGDIKHDEPVSNDEEGNLNMVNGGGRPKKWAVLKFWTQEDRKKPNKRKIEDKIKELMKKEEEEDLSEHDYFKDLVKKEKTAKKWEKLKKLRRKIRKPQSKKKKGGKKRKRTKKKRRKRR